MNEKKRSYKLCQIKREGQSDRERAREKETLKNIYSGRSKILSSLYSQIFLRFLEP